MRGSIEIHNTIKALRAQQAAVPAGRNREAKLFEFQGRIDAADRDLALALASEDQARAGGSGRIVGGFLGGFDPTAQAFGPKASFKGVGAGFKAAITIPAAPAVGDPVVPGFRDVPRGFADTLIQAPAAGAVTFLRRGVHTNGAAQWKTGDGAKAESGYAYEEATAPLAWIAHHTPISKTEASDWGQLDAIMRNEMLVGLSQAKSREALVGANATGITGVLNTLGVQPYDPTVNGAADDTVYDSIRRMATRVLLSSGFMPTHVAMSPQVKEDLDLLKGTDGHYLAVTVGDRAWNLEIVQDVGLTVVDEAEATHNGVLVYSSSGATWYVKEADNVEIGLVDDQFINNAYTLLAEGRNALAVKYPDAFCYCADAIPQVPAA